MKRLDGWTRNGLAIGVQIQGDKVERGEWESEESIRTQR